MAGVEEYRANGFREECIYKCISGAVKTHRGHTFERINKGESQ